MANPTRIDDLVVQSTLRCPSDAISAQGRATIMLQEPLKLFPIPWTFMRKHDAYDAVLPGAGTGAYLGLVGGTFGSAQPVLQSGDVKASTTTRYARFQVVLPECYDAGETVNIVLTAGMVTTVADGSCTVDIECYRCGKDNSIGPDICATSATTINSISLSAKSFTITASTLSPGDILDVRVTIACVDSATVTAVKPTIAGIDLACDIRG